MNFHIPTFLNIALSVLFAVACSHYAKQRGRNPLIWFTVGAIFGIFGLITLLLLPMPKKPNRVLGKPAAPPMPSFSLRFATHTDKFWYFLDHEKKQIGPMSFNALSKAKIEGAIGEQTFVWNEEMENWQHFKDVIQSQ